MRNYIKNILLSRGFGFLLKVMWAYSRILVIFACVAPLSMAYLDHGWGFVTGKLIIQTIVILIIMGIIAIVFEEILIQSILKASSSRIPISRYLH